MAQPNIIFIITDQQRRDSLGVYGCRYPSTPNLDRLAGGATVYEHCYCDAPICTPSRASILTGKTMTGHGVFNLFDILPKNERLLPSYLKDLGYQTAIVGKLHVSSTEFEAYERNPGDGFDIYEMAHEPSIYLESPYNAYAHWLKANYPDEYAALLREGRKRTYRSAETHFTTWVSQRSAELIRHRDKSKPFFLLAGYFDPHNPYNHYPPEAAEALHEEAYEEPIPGDIASAPMELQWERSGHKPEKLGAVSGPEGVRSLRRGYFAGISFIDRQVQMILDALKEEGIYDNTLIIYTADHGDMAGDHDLFAKGAVMYEDGINVPLIVKYPGQTEGRRLDDPVALHDLFNTMYKAAGGDIALRPESIPLNGEEKRPFVVTEYNECGKFDITTWPESAMVTMIRDREWKLIVYHNSLRQQLFHLTEDPDEEHDLSDRPEYVPVVMRMMQQLLHYHADRDRKINAARGGRSGIPGFANVPERKK